MNRKSFRLSIASIVIFATIALLICNFGSPDKEWPGRIRSRTIYPVTMLLNPHVSPINVLTIDGKRFEHVRGFKPFYLRVPGSNALVFVTDEKDYSIVYHVFDLDTDEDSALRARSGMFGHEIGSTQSNRVDTVEKTSEGQIILCNEYKGTKSVLPSLDALYEVKSLVYIDLAKKALVADKTIYYDKDGKILDQPDAKAP